MLTIIQNTWNEEEDQELLDYMKNNDISFEIKDENEILLSNIKSLKVLFADTSITQQLIDYDVPTYPEWLNSFYNRKIEKVNVNELGLNDCPYFVKPYYNDKSFSATVVKDKYDLSYIKEFVQKDNLVYKCQSVQFVNEYRLFIEKNKLFAIQESSEYILNESIIQSQTPSSVFINKILQTIPNKYPYIVIDVGMLDDGTWCVVEANPPYAISSYGLPIDKYYEYCSNVWQSIS